METISHLNQQLHDCQRQYTDLLTSKSVDTFNQTETKRQLTRMTEDKENLETTCQDLQVIKNFIITMTIKAKAYPMIKFHKFFHQ